MSFCESSKNFVKLISEFILQKLDEVLGLEVCNLNTTDYILNGVPDEPDQDLMIPLMNLLNLLKSLPKSQNKGCLTDFWHTLDFTRKVKSGEGEV